MFKYSITAQPGVLTMIRMVRPYALRPWRVPYSEESLAGVGYGLSPLQLTGKLCCVDQQRRSRKVQLQNGKPVGLDYCDAPQPELP